MPRQNGRQFADDIFKCIILKENPRILIQTSLSVVSDDSIDNKSALFQVMYVLYNLADDRVCWR